jgi:hypothetical protein
MARLDDLSFYFPGTHNSDVEIVEFKPQENAISIRPKFGIPEWTVMVLHIPSVQLKNQCVTRDQSLILGTTMPALATKEVLIPATARLDVAHANEGL